MPLQKHVSTGRCRSHLKLSTTAGRFCCHPTRDLQAPENAPSSYSCCEGTRLYLLILRMELFLLFLWCSCRGFRQTWQFPRPVHTILTAWHMVHT